jgi:hypothetical protein
MKIVTVEIDDQIYPKLIEFLEHLPKGHYELLEDDESLDDKERAEIAAIRNRLHEVDEREFEDWSTVRKDL